MKYNQHKVILDCNKTYIFRKGLFDSIPELLKHQLTESFQTNHHGLSVSNASPTAIISAWVHRKKLNWTALPAHKERKESNKKEKECMWTDYSLRMIKKTFHAPHIPNMITISSPHQSITYTITSQNSQNATQKHQYIHHMPWAHPSFTSKPLSRMRCFKALIFTSAGRDSDTKSERSSAGTSLQKSTQKMSFLWPSTLKNATM